MDRATFANARTHARSCLHVGRPRARHSFSQAGSSTGGGAASKADLPRGKEFPCTHVIDTSSSIPELGAEVAQAITEYLDHRFLSSANTRAGRPWASSQSACHTFDSPNAHSLELLANAFSDLAVSVLLQSRDKLGNPDDPERLHRRELCHQPRSCHRPPLRD